MTQKGFTEYVAPKFRANFPQLKEYQIEIHRDVTYLELASRQGKLNILISTRDKMLTIGFSAGPGLFAWHDHLPGNESIDRKIAIASEWINNIIHDRKGIIHSSVLGPFPGGPEELEDVTRYGKEDEVIESKYWSDF